jgi:polyvinyl alcohol dehydrogenase (cytochrome)
MRVRKRVVLAAIAVVLAGVPATAGQWSGDWPGWSGPVAGTRFNPAEHRLTPDTVGWLKLKWAFAYDRPGFAIKSQPAVVDGSIYFGGPDGRFYALDARTGATRWTFALTQAVVIDAPTVVGGRVYFGDSRGNVYALSARTGSVLWVRNTEPHPAGIHTSSPLYHRGRIYIGASSGENVNPDVNYPCCTFRGHIDSLDAATGELVWRYLTVPEPRATGTWPSGATRYEPSGAGVWSTPVIDGDTLYVGTGQNYSGSGGDFDSLLALDVRSGAVRWKQQVTKADTWRLLCGKPDNEGFCPGQRDGTALDYDIGATPNLLRVGDRTLVGVGQKSGVYHVFDARTGEVMWRRQLGRPIPGGGIGGIQWGASTDGKRVYVTTYLANPGTLFALDPATGAEIWATPNPADGCTTGGAAQFPNICLLAHPGAATSSPGLVWEGSNDGKVRAYAARDGRVLWTYDTVRDFDGVNGVPGRGNVISAAGGVVVANGMLYVQAGGALFSSYPSGRGSVLLAFGL